LDFLLFALNFIELKGTMKIRAKMHAKGFWDGEILANIRGILGVGFG